MARSDAIRSLGLIRASGSTARVLNLPLVQERFGVTPEYQAQPLFRVPVFNRALLLKHVVRAHERQHFDHPPSTTLKIVFAFSKRELHLGGHSIMFGERNFDRVIKEACGSSNDSDLTADIELLGLLNSLPSFDPFLMRERLRQNGYEPARCYFDLSNADVLQMRTFVTGEIGQLVDLAAANSGGSTRELARKLADKLMTDETAKGLDPLRIALQLSIEDYREGVFAWKGFLYYRWLALSLLPSLSDFKHELLSLRVNGADAETRIQLATARARLGKLLDAAVKRVDEALLDYGTAYFGLSSGEAAVFRSFLLRAPSMFVSTGEAIGVIQHMMSFWRFRFPRSSQAIMHADDAFEIYADFEATLANLDFSSNPDDCLMAC